MSFILDALKKSDMQARQGELPSIHSSHSKSNGYQHRRGWQYALFSGAVAGLVLAASFLLLPDRTNVQPQTPAAIQPESDKTPALQNQPSNAVSEPAPGTAPMVKTSPHMTENSEIRPSENQAASSVQPPPQTEEPAALALPDFAPQGNLPPPLKSKLPLNLQQAMPPIDISGHIFDERPAARMVFINGHIQREGDTISPRLRLVVITPSGVEMSFHNTLFRIDLFANRVPRGNN